MNKDLALGPKPSNDRACRRIEWYVGALILGASCMSGCRDFQNCKSLGTCNPEGLEQLPPISSNLGGGGAADDSQGPGGAGEGGRLTTTPAATASSPPPDIPDLNDGPSTGGPGPCIPIPLGALGQPCCTTGMLGCAGHNQKSTLICGPDLRWQSNGACFDNRRCDTTKGPDQGTCMRLIHGCEAPGQWACFGDFLGKCGPDMVTLTEAIACDQGCGHCLPP